MSLLAETLFARGTVAEAQPYGSLTASRTRIGYAHFVLPEVYLCASGYLLTPYVWPHYEYGRSDSQTGLWSPKKENK